MKKPCSGTENLKGDADFLSDTLAIAAFSFLVATFSVLLLGAIAGLIPPQINAFAKDLFPLSLYDLRPEHESLLYRAWIVIAIAVGAAAHIFLNKGVLPGNAFIILRPWIVALLFFIGLACVFIFKWWLWQMPWARGAFYLTVSAGTLALIFMPEIRKLKPIRLWPWLYEGCFAAVMGIAFIPVIKPCLSVIFAKDNLYHIDSMIMAPAWALSKGLQLNIDVGSEYSTMIPWFFAQVMQLLGGIDYARALGVLAGIGLSYYIMCYIFLKRLTQNVVLAASGILLLMALQHFHWGVVPFMWQYPSATPLRYFFDMPFLLCMLAWVQAGDRRALMAGLLFLSLALAWMIDTGLYLWGAWAVCVVFYQLKKSWHWPSVLMLLGAPIIGAIIIASLVSPQIWGAGDYWQKSQEFIALFLRGWGALPVTDALASRQYLAVACGMLLPFFYVLALLVAGARYVLGGAQKRDLLRAGLSLYGLGLYHYYVHRSAVTSYLVVITPLLLLAADYLCVYLRRYAAAPVIKRVLLGLAALMLLTNIFFIQFPNLFNGLGKDWRAQVQVYEAAVDFKVDARLIASLTAPHEKVALISSFETALLMQADRAPFFYYFPLMESSFFSQPLRQSYMHTPKRTERLQAQFQQQPPKIIFIEQRLWQAYQQGRLVPQAGLTALVSFIDKQYVVQEKGQYLLALGLRP